MIDTFSKFYYGFDITASNNNIPFREGGIELNAVIQIGSYALSEFVVAITSAMNTASLTQTYSASVNRFTRKITISSSGNFDLLFNSGLTAGTSASSEMGFSFMDLIGDSSYVSQGVAGDFYEPQFLLQDFVSNEDLQEFIQPSVNESGSGRIEVVRFGINTFFEFSLRFITNIQMDNTVIRNNPNGVADARRFLRFITKRTRFEFMPDKDDPNTFFKVLLERIPDNSTATGYRLQELTRDKLRDIFEISGIIRLRTVT